MNTMNADVTDVDSPRAQELKTVGWISYVLHLIVAIGAVIPFVQFGSIWLLIVAFVLDLIYKDDAAGTWQQSHFSWRIRTVLWAGLLYLITAPLYLLFWLPGAIAWFIVSLWFFYRIVKGMSAMNASKAVRS
jgi:uncharacterized membrane protein